MRSLHGTEIHDIPDDEEDEPYLFREWSFTINLSPMTYSYTDFGQPNASSINSKIAQAPWIPQSNEPGNLVTGSWKEAMLGTPAKATASYWSDYWNSWTYHNWDASRTDYRFRLVVAQPATESYAEQYLMITRDADMGEWGQLPWFGEMEVSGIEPVEMRIQTGQQSSSWHTIGVEAADGKHRTLGMKRFDITVVCGIGPGGQDMSSKELLEQYLETVKIWRNGDIWLVQGKDGSDQDREYVVQIATDESTLLDALKAPERTVIYDGHANFGLGPSFSVATHKTIGSFTNFGVNCTAIPQTFRGQGTEADVLPYFGTGVDVPDDLAIERALARMDNEGWSYLTLQSGEIKGTVRNYDVPEIGGLRFPNASGVAADEDFTKTGTGFNNEWHFINSSGEMMLMVNAPDTKVPQDLGYRTFFYNACSSGPHFSENFQHGELIYTNQSCNVFWATRRFVKALIEGKTTSQAVQILNSSNASGEGENVVVYESHSF